jgi:hypothetical protein
MTYRGLRYGEYKRRGANGWFRRENHPIEFAYTMALQSALFCMFLVMIWILAGKPGL